MQTTLLIGSHTTMVSREKEREEKGCACVSQMTAHSQRSPGQTSRYRFPDKHPTSEDQLCMMSVSDAVEISMWFPTVEGSFWVPHETHEDLHAGECRKK